MGRRLPPAASCQAFAPSRSSIPAFFSGPAAQCAATGRGGEWPSRLLDRGCGLGLPCRCRRGTTPQQGRREVAIPSGSLWLRCPSRRNHDRLCPKHTRGSSGFSRPPRRVCLPPLRGPGRMPRQSCLHSPDAYSAAEFKANGLKQPECRLFAVNRLVAAMRRRWQANSRFSNPLVTRASPWGSLADAYPRRGLVGFLWESLRATFLYPGINFQPSRRRTRGGSKGWAALPLQCRCMPSIKL